MVSQISSKAIIFKILAFAIKASTILLTSVSFFYIYCASKILFKNIIKAPV